jgi:hypothetical protein
MVETEWGRPWMMESEGGMSELRVGSAVVKMNDEGREGEVG